MINTSIFKAYDIRGIYPSELNAENIARITGAILYFFKQKLGKDNPSVVLGRDMRLSSPELFAAAKKVLLEHGAEVIDVGLVSTPTFYFAVSNFNYDCGIQITASHNPKDYNGIKFVLNSNKGLIKIGKNTGMDEIKDLSISGDFTLEKQDGKLVTRDDVVSEEVRSSLKLLGSPKFKSFKIVADTANAMGAVYIEEIFKNIDAELIKMNFELDGTFPSHQPDPLDFENLRELQTKVLSENADLGLAPDGDGDRMFFIDEKGKVVPASVITGIIAKELLEDNPGGTILYDIRYVMSPQKAIFEAGGKSEISLVGHAFITEGMAEKDAVFAGESSGHYFYRATGNAESQVMTVLIVLNALSKRNIPLSRLAEEMSASFESGEINFKVTNAKEIAESIKTKYHDGELSEMDGLAIDFPDWRLSLRTSNTEPLLRLNIEAKNAELLSEKLKDVTGQIKEVAKQVE